MTLIIYDESGQVFSQVSGSYVVPNGGIQFIEAEIPTGKRVVGIDVTVEPHQVILEDIPLTEVDIIKQENAELLMKSAMTEMELESIKKENSDLMLRVANLEMGGSVNV